MGERGVSRNCGRGCSVARRYKLRNCKGVVIGGSFSQRYVFGETMLDSGKNRTNKGYMKI